MFYLRAANQRGLTQTDWLESYHTFAFGNYCDADFAGFSDLRVINDDIIAPGAGFGTHPHDNMEIISIVLSGQLEHKDSLGNGSVIKAGEVQKMSAGKGILHSEYNPSLSSETHFLQIWIIPNIRDIAPSYEQRKFDKQATTNNLTLIVSPDGRDNSIMLQQNSEIYQAYLEKDKEVTFNVHQTRSAWIQIAQGSVVLNGQIMVRGDGMAISKENANISIKGVDELSNVLVFNLNG